MCARRRFSLTLAAFTACLLAAPQFRAAEPVLYHLTFPEPEHRWMQVEVSFTGLVPAPLDLRMSRSSPGRYSLHDFAQNVYDLHAFGRDGRELVATQSDPHGWTVAGHGGAVTVRYKVYGDRVDGTYLAVDTTHAHINMPAALMWARDLDDRPARVTIEPPVGVLWQVATQLHPGSTPFEFTAPNFQYLMDSPVEVGPISIRQFTVGSRTFRFAVHHTGAAADVDGLVKDVERIVRQEGEVYGEFPEYEPGYYTFLADYLPWATVDGMEHRNSTVMTSSGSIGNRRDELLDTVAHEFFHGWNVERIRPRSLEPFDFDRANMSGELWLAEGFTQYYGPLLLQRAGVVDLPSTLRTLTGLVAAATESSGRLFRSAEEMSRLAPFTDGRASEVRTNSSSTVTSYYSLGGAIALALDLTLRGRSDGKSSLDDYMRAMWRVHGRPGGAREGYVDRPYTMADAEARLAEVSGDTAFAREFFARYIQGHDAADYSRLLAPAGLMLGKPNAGRAWWGNVRLESRGGKVYVSELVAPGTPAYTAGLEQDDEVRQVDGDRITSVDSVAGILRRHKPGERIQIVFADRSGAARTANVTLVEDPQQEIATIEASGGVLTPEQQAFRASWLGPQR